jgi:hypothetical protein
MSTKKGLFLTVLCLVALALTASSCIPPEAAWPYPWASPKHRMVAWPHKLVLFQYHPPLFAGINEQCELTITDSAGNVLEDPEAWAGRRIVFTNNTEYLGVYIIFEDPEWVTYGGNIYLPPNPPDGNSVTTTFRSTVGESTDQIAFEVKCNGPGGEVTSEVRLVWKYPPPDPSSGPPPVP